MSLEYDLNSRIKIVHVIPPAVYTADAVGAIINVGPTGTAPQEQGFLSMCYLIHIGTALIGGGFICIFEESDVVTFGGEETVVPAANVLGGSPIMVATDANETRRVGIVGKKQYQRLTLDETGTVTAGVIGATALLANPRFIPIPAQTLSA